MLKHTFSSAKADGGDATLVQPSNWNAEHVTDADGLKYLSRSSTGNPSATSSGYANIFFKTVAGKPVPKFIDEFGIDTEIQASLFHKKVRGMMIGGDGTTNNTMLGLGAYTAVGSTTRTPASTSAFTRMSRHGYVSAAGAGSLASARSGSLLITVGDGSGNGGFYRAWRFGCSDAATVSGARQFVGISNTISAPTNVEPSTLTNSIGIGNGAADTNLKIYYGGSAAQTPVDLGANYPANTLSADVYDFVIYSPPSSNNTVYYAVRRIGTAFETSGTLTGTAGTALPASTTFLNPMWMYRTNNATALAVGIDLMSDLFITDF